MTTKRAIKISGYSRFAAIDGRHPLRDAVPNSSVDYQARLRPDGSVFYFNFDLAKEMGLISRDHPAVVNSGLAQAILDTFSIVIINEYDVIHKTPIVPASVKPYPYMATRYLQLQHPSKNGETSGDGRSIWNGCYQGRGGTWDVSSCGTGATCLSPATAIEKKFFKTGDRHASYGCGRADLSDGVAAAIMSDIFHRSGITTERTLAVIGFADGSSINVRAGRNLLRPAHMFRYLKQNDYGGLKSAVDYYIARQVANGDWPTLRGEKRKYGYFLERIAMDFARAVARFESEYIFCWLDWDGDNILTDGGILDYGSIRQFGLYHHEYRYDDVERWSTTITEQKAKAKYIVQTFAQIADFLLTGQKKNIKRFGRHGAMRLFDSVFEWAKDESLLRRMGYSAPIRKKLLDDRRAQSTVRRFRKACEYFEKAKSVRGLYEVEDGITWDAIFCMRDILRELPQRYRESDAMLSPAEFLAILRSAYAAAEDMVLTASRRQKVKAFQVSYRKLIEHGARLSGKTERSVLRELSKRAAVINRYERVTGDAIVRIAETLVASASKMRPAELQETIEVFIDSQVLIPGYQRRGRVANLTDSRPSAAVYASLLQIVRDYRDGI